MIDTLPRYRCMIIHTPESISSWRITADSIAHCTSQLLYCSVRSEPGHQERPSINIRVCFPTVLLLTLSLEPGCPLAIFALLLQSALISSSQAKTTYGKVHLVDIYVDGHISAQSDANVVVDTYLYQLGTGLSCSLVSNRNFPYDRRT
jgi:hypothetical protein